MPNPRDLLSKARRPVRAPEPPPAPPAPVQYGTVIERRSFDPATGEVTIHRFDGPEESTEIIPAASAPATSDLSDAQREGPRGAVEPQPEHVVDDHLNRPGFDGGGGYWVSISFS